MPAARFAVLLFAALALHAAAQQPPPQPAAARSSLAEVRIETHDNRSQFTLDEPITLDLIFTAQSSGYSVNVTNYGDMSETLHIAPTEGWLITRTASGHDYAQEEALTPGKPIRVSVLLNQGLVFQRPGHYEVSITTSRLVEPRPAASSPRTTNAIALDITAPNEEREAENVHWLSNQIATLRGRPRTEAAEKLAFLSSDDAVREKVHWLLVTAGDNESSASSAIIDGLGSSRNLKLQLDLLETAWRDPQRIPTTDLQQALAESRRFLRHQSVAGWQMAIGPPTTDAEKLAEQEHLRDLQIIVDSLPQRTGANRTHTAYYLMGFAGLSWPEVKTVVLEEFPHMDAMEQDMLLSNHSKDLGDLALVPTLKDILAANPNDRDALQRLVALEPDAARPFVLRALCDPKSSILLDQVAAMPDKTLREVNGCLLDQLQQRLPILTANPAFPVDLQFEWKAELAARFATAEILPAMRDLYRTAKSAESPNISYPRPAAAVFTYLLRYSPTEAVAILQSSSGVPDLYEPGRIYSLSHEKFPPELHEWLRHKLQQGTPSEGAWAAYQLSRFGGLEDKSLLRLRLDQFHQQWAPRAAELESLKSAGNDDPLAQAAMVETGLMLPLIAADSVWATTPEEKSALAKTCLTAACKAFFH